MIQISYKMGNVLWRTARLQVSQPRHATDIILDARSAKLRELGKSHASLDSKSFKNIMSISVLYADAARDCALMAVRAEADLDSSLPHTETVEKLIRAIKPHKIDMYNTKACVILFFIVISGLFFQCRYSKNVLQLCLLQDLKKLSRRRAQEATDDMKSGRLTTGSIRSALDDLLR